MRRIKKILLITLVTMTIIFSVIVIGLTVVSFNAYKPLDEMYDAIETLDIASVEMNEYYDSYKLKVTNPKGQIVIIPGGLVYTESYLYLAYNLALNGYNVTLSKALFHLAILTPNYASRFLSSTLPNIIIGHSLGGTVGGLITSKYPDKVDHLILLASYTTTKIDKASTLLIQASNDEVINKDKFDDSLVNYSNYQMSEINGGNHAGFGWYGKQKGDGTATITTIDQQNQIIDIIILYLNS